MNNWPQEPTALIHEHPDDADRPSPIVGTNPFAFRSRRRGRTPSRPAARASPGRPGRAAEVELAPGASAANPSRSRGPRRRRPYLVPRPRHRAGRQPGHRARYWAERARRNQRRRRRPARASGRRPAGPRRRRLPRHDSTARSPAAGRAGRGMPSAGPPRPRPTCPSAPASSGGAAVGVRRVRPRAPRVVNALLLALLGLAAGLLGRLLIATRAMAAALPHSSAPAAWLGPPANPGSLRAPLRARFTSRSRRRHASPPRVGPGRGTTSRLPPFGSRLRALEVPPDSPAERRSCASRRSSVGLRQRRERQQPGRPRVRGQARAIEAHVRGRGFALEELVRDIEPQTGGDLGRPGLMYALERIAAREASCLVVAGLERLARSAADIGTLVEWFEQNEAGWLPSTSGWTRGPIRAHRGARAGGRWPSGSPQGRRADPQGAGGGAGEGTVHGQARGERPPGAPGTDRRDARSEG